MPRQPQEAGASLYRTQPPEDDVGGGAAQTSSSNININIIRYTGYMVMTFPIFARGLVCENISNNSIRSICHHYSTIRTNMYSCVYVCVSVASLRGESDFMFVYCPSFDVAEHTAVSSGTAVSYLASADGKAAARRRPRTNQQCQQLPLAQDLLYLFRRPGTHKERDREIHTERERGVGGERERDPSGISLESRRTDPVWACMYVCV